VRRDPNSLLNWMERIVRMRKEVPEIGWGDFSFISAGTPEVLVMRYIWQNNSVLCVHNLCREPREIRFSIQPDEKQCILPISYPTITVNLIRTVDNECLALLSPIESYFRIARDSPGTRKIESPPMRISNAC
jgi:hypothetical protein